VTDKRRGKPAWGLLSGIGFEFVAAIVGLALVGYWIDRHYQTSPRYVLIGFGVGLVGATYNLIRQTGALTRETDRQSKKKRKDPK